jgi:hypothetical protein
LSFTLFVELSMLSAPPSTRTPAASATAAKPRVRRASISRRMPFASHHAHSAAQSFMRMTGDASPARGVSMPLAALPSSSTSPVVTPSAACRP